MTTFKELYEMLIRRDAAIEELVAKCGYLPEAYAILEKHGLRDPLPEPIATRAVDGPLDAIDPNGWQDCGDCSPV